MTETTVFYFAYGSNTDPDRFRARVGEWRSRRKARLDGHRLRFAASVQSEGGGGAVIDGADTGHVDGVLYEITEAQMARMDREEFDAARDTNGAGRRVSVTVATDDGPRTAHMYNADDDGARRAPSDRYLAHIVRGLEAAGHSAEAIDAVRRAAEESEA